MLIQCENCRTNHFYSRNKSRKLRCSQCGHILVWKSEPRKTGLKWVARYLLLIPAQKPYRWFENGISMKFRLVQKALGVMDRLWGVLCDEPTYSQLEDLYNKEKKLRQELQERLEMVRQFNRHLH